MSKQPVYWTGKIGGFDDFGAPYDLKPGGVMYDAKTVDGMWACMTEASFKKYSHNRLGTGWGQKYELQQDGRWLKVEG